MADPEHLEILKQGADIWNKWRHENQHGPGEMRDADLSNADLRNTDLSNAKLFQVDLSNADLSNVNLFQAHLRFANLQGANLTGAEFKRAELSNVDLTKANLTRANILFAHFDGVDFSGAKLRGADLSWTKINGGKVDNADFSKSRLFNTVFSGLDMSNVYGLSTVLHYGPSTIGIDTLFRSQGKISEIFLRGCGVPEELITYIPSLIGAGQSIQFYSCFISYSTQDEQFAKRLHSRMRDANLRVWFAPEDMKGGEKIFDQIDFAIQQQERLLLVLSEQSMQSEWVFTEIRKALKVEKKEGRRKLFPIRLVDFEKIKEWELFDADSGRDLAVEIRSYFISDFSKWKHHDAFEKAFEKLLKDLRAAEK